MTDASAGRPPPSLGDGRYLIVDSLGDGGTAAVYLAWDTTEDRWCALKALLHRCARDTDMRRRFGQEAQTMRQLSHPNIPKLFDWQPDSEPPFMVMELARCGSTMGWVRENGPMPCSMAADVLFQICLALAEAHAAGVVHRDVKPHNFLLDDEGHCKLTDFGIARHSERTSLTATGSQIGTFSFMAPEQRSDTKSVDHRADIYSLGASLYTLLTARTSAELFVADKDDDLLEDVPNAFREIVLTACRYRPEERYDSALELQTHIMNALSRIPPTQEDYPPLVRSPAPLPDGPPILLPADRRFEDLEAWGHRAPPPQTLPPAPARHPTPIVAARFSNTSGTHAIPYYMPARGQTPVPEETRDSVPSYVADSDRGSLERQARRNLHLRIEKEVAAEVERTLTSEPAPARAVEDEARDQRVARMLALSLAGAVVVAVLLVVSLGAGMVQVSMARGEADVAAVALLASLEANVSVAYEMRGDRRRFEALYDDYRDARGTDRVVAAVAFVDAVDAAVRSGAPLDRAAEPKIQELREARAVYGHAVEHWSRAASGFPGGMAAGIGLASRPPRL